MTTSRPIQSYDIRDTDSHWWDPTCEQKPSKVHVRILLTSVLQRIVWSKMSCIYCVLPVYFHFLLLKRFSSSSTSFKTTQDAWVEAQGASPALWILAEWTAGFNSSSLGQRNIPRVRSPESSLGPAKSAAFGTRRVSEIPVELSTWSLCDCGVAEASVSKATWPQWMMSPQMAAGG